MSIIGLISQIFSNLQEQQKQFALLVVLEVHGVVHCHGQEEGIAERVIFHRPTVAASESDVETAVACCEDHRTRTLGLDRIQCLRDCIE